MTELRKPWRAGQISAVRGKKLWPPGWEDSIIRWEETAKDSPKPVSEQDPMGLSQDRAFPIGSAVGPLWRTQVIVFDVHFLSCFTDAKPSTKWKKLTTWWPWAHSPQTYWSLRIVNPCDTTLLPHHHPIRDLCTSWSPPSPGLEKCFAENPSGSLGFLSSSGPGLPSWCLEINTALSFITTGVGRLPLLCMGWADPSFVREQTHRSEKNLEIFFFVNKFFTIYY